MSSASNVEMNEAAQVANSGVVSPANRLVIEKIVMENFKSYAGVREIGPFHKVSLCTTQCAITPN